MFDPMYMDSEFQLDEPNVEFDITNANDVEFEEEPMDMINVADKPIVQSSSVDLETLTTSYTGHGLMNRLWFIADVCPPLRYDAFKMLIEYIMKNTQNVNYLVSVYQKVDKYKLAGDMTGIEKIPPLDNNWIATTAAKSQSLLETYLAEFKRQKDEAVKESIRRSLDEVFHQYVHMGNLVDALKLFNRGMREYCTSPNYVLQMLISWINVTVYAGQWQKLAILLPQAERAIVDVVDRENVQNNSNSRATSSYNLSGTGAQSKNSKELVRSSKAKIAAVNGLAKMQDRHYKQAAEQFMTVDIDALDYPQLLSASDVAMYGTLCALATFSRVELKERVLGSTLFRKFLESEPKLVELLQKFCRSEFGVCLDILNELKDQALLNMFLAPHLPTLQMLIRRSSIIQYFHPYLSASIHQMAEVFRTTPDAMEHELIDLIELGLLSARIDSYGKIIYAKFSDNRVEIYKRVMNLRKRLNERVYSILLRTALQNHKIGLCAEKASRRRRGNNPNSIFDFMDIDDGDTAGTSANTSNSASSSNKLIAHVQRLWSAATLRMHSNNDTVAPSVCFGNGASVTDPVADAFERNKNDSGSTSRSSNTKPTSSEMELDENLSDI